jgi:mannose-1-phosphate guanylyltransferase/phosphomannomutase
MLASRGLSLADLLVGLPPVNVVHERVPTPFDLKGVVMRRVLESARGEEVVLVDGVKTVDPSGWTLVVPDGAAALTHVYAEADDAESARRRADEAIALIQGYLLAAREEAARV